MTEFQVARVIQVSRALQEAKVNQDDQDLQVVQDNQELTDFQVYLGKREKRACLVILFEIISCNLFRWLKAFLLIITSDI